MEDRSKVSGSQWVVSKIDKWRNANGNTWFRNVEKTPERVKSICLWGAQELGRPSGVLAAFHDRPFDTV